MNIIIDGHSLHVLGGMERTITDLASNLAERGHNVFYFLTEDPPVPLLYTLHANVNIIIYTHNGRRDHLAKFREQVLAYSPDICISPASDRRHFPWCVALKNTGIPLIVSEHCAPSTIELEMLTQKERYAILESADAIRLLLPSYMQGLPKHLQEKTYAIHNAVNQPKVSLVKHAYPIVISMGRLSSEKQNHLLIDAFALLQKEFPHWQVHIWGTGAEQNHLQKQITKYQLEKNVFLKGLTKTPEQCFALSDIACLPSRYEGFPGAVAQAMTVGLPVVGFAGCPGTNEMIQNGRTGLLVEKMDASALAQSLSILMENEKLRISMGEEGKKVAQAYSPQKVFDQWEELLHKVRQSKNATSLQRKSTHDILDEVLNKGLAKKSNVLVGENDITRAIIFQFPWLKRLLHPIYLWFKCRSLK